MTKTIKNILRGVETLTNISGSMPTPRPQFRSAKPPCVRISGATCAKSDVTNISRDNHKVASDFHVAIEGTKRGTINGSKIER